MDEELALLESRLSRLLANTHRLIEENHRLGLELARAQADNADLRECIAETRSRVTLALARLQADPTIPSELMHLREDRLGLGRSGAPILS